VFVGMAVLVTLTSSQSAVTEFNETRTRVAVINRDGDAPLARGLADYIADRFTVVPYEDDPDELQDALFYRDVDYVAIIPQGFSAAFMAAGSRGPGGPENPGHAGDQGQATTNGASSGSSRSGQARIAGPIDSMPGQAEALDQKTAVAQTAVIQKVVVPASTSSRYVDIRIDEFLNAASIHRDLEARGDLEMAGEARERAEDRNRQARLVAAVRADLAAETPVSLRMAEERSEASRESDSRYASYFAYQSYALVAMVMMGISSIMIAFNRRDLRLRSLCTPAPQRGFDIAIAAGHAVFALGCWAITVLFGVILNGTGPFSSGRGWLYLANSLVLTSVAAAIGFAVGHFVKTSSGQSGAVNVISLGMSFLCGVFMPQAIMRQSVLAVAKFLPVYWYIRANDAIAALAGSASGSAHPIYGFMLVQLGFAAAILSVTLLFSKERRLAEL
ncbi:MAG: ABC transporter permease, partial [Bacteroidota bacterium]